MKTLPTTPSTATVKLAAEDSKWDIRPIRKHDLELVAGWITMLMQNGHGREREVAGFLKMEWDAGRDSSFARYYVVTLYGQPMMHVTARTAALDGGSELATMNLDLFLHPSFTENEDICLAVLSTTFSFFFSDEETRCLKVSLAHTDKVMKKALRQLGFVSARSEGRYTSTFQTWIPLP